MKKSELETKLHDLRKAYVTASSKDQESIIEAGNALKEKISKTNWCRQCGNAEITIVDSFCSVECQDLYYPPASHNPSIKDMQMKLLEMAKRAYLKR